MSETQMLIFAGGRRAQARGRGRPTLYGSRAQRRLEVVVTDEQKKDLDSVAADQGKPLATVIREAINEYVTDYREKPVFPK